MGACARPGFAPRRSPSPATRHRFSSAKLAARFCNWSSVRACVARRAAAGGQVQVVARARKIDSRRSHRRNAWRTGCAARHPPRWSRAAVGMWQPGTASTRRTGCGTTRNRGCSGTRPRSAAGVQVQRVERVAARTQRRLGDVVALLRHEPGCIMHYRRQVWIAGEAIVGRPVIDRPLSIDGESAAEARYLAEAFRLDLVAQCARYAIVRQRVVRMIRAGEPTLEQQARHCPSR